MDLSFFRLDLLFEMSEEKAGALTKPVILVHLSSADSNRTLSSHRKRADIKAEHLQDHSIKQVYGRDTVPAQRAQLQALGPTGKRETRRTL